MRDYLRARYYFIPHVSTLLALVLAWWTLDRRPPLVLYDGRIAPAIVRPNEADISVTWRAHFSGRDCPGYTQRELVDSEHNLWPKRKRARGGVFHPDADNPSEGTVTTPPLTIPPQMASGPAYYRVTQFYYCNWLQRALRWPIVQPSPKIPFYVEGVGAPQ